MAQEILKPFPTLQSARSGLSAVYSAMVLSFVVVHLC